MVTFAPPKRLFPVTLLPSISFVEKDRLVMGEASGSCAASFFPQAQRVRSRIRSKPEIFTDFNQNVFILHLVVTYPVAMLKR